uniref:Nucleotide-diphospho-sugar transferase domain-containing protein n=2 Tax=Haptolina ericina TaxID=156174 RepID=A0A7S3AKX1_9EUKA
MVMQRPLWVLHLLQRNYETLQVDLDISWLIDPQPMFRSQAYASFDLLFQSEGGHGYNAGFYLARPSAGSLGILKKWTVDLTKQAGSKSFEEQHSLGRSLGHRNKSTPLLFAKLNISQFPNGKIWWQYRQPVDKRDAYVVHCNWNKGNKKGRFMRDNLWSLDEEDSRCRPSWDPYMRDCHRNCVGVRYCTPGKPCPRESCKALAHSMWHPMARIEAGCNATLPPKPLKLLAKPLKLH